MAFEGMDTDLAGVQLSTLQTQGVDVVQNAITQLNGLIGQIADNWKGPDATNFHHEWQSNLSSQLNNVHQALIQFHTTFNHNIQQQIQASA